MVNSDSKFEDIVGEILVLILHLLLIRWEYPNEYLKVLRFSIVLVFIVSSEL